jgi:hypothetical protein
VPFSTHRQTAETFVRETSLHPPRTLFESQYMLQHSYTCCHTQCLPGSREHKGESYEGRTVWSNRKLRPTYLEGTHHSGASGYGSRPGYLEDPPERKSAYAPPPDNTDALISVTEREIAAVKKAGHARLIVVGGAGLLEVAPGVTLIASGYLPEAYLPIARSHEKALGVLKASDINWTYFSPAAYFEPGERTGKFRLGTTNLIANEKGDSRISFEDYAVALVDEIEKPTHERGQLSIGY